MKALFSKFVNSDMDMAALRFSVIAVVMLFGMYSKIETTRTTS